MPRNRTTPRRPWRRVGPTVYDRLDLTDVRLDRVLVGTRGRAALLAFAVDNGYPARTVTPAVTRFSRVYVLQLGGDLDAGTVTLATIDEQAVTVTLPAEFRWRKASRPRLTAVLDAVGADYPPGSLTAALAEALSAVLDLCGQARQRTRHLPIESVEETVTVPLRPFLTPWTPTTTTATTLSTEEDQ